MKRIEKKYSHRQYYTQSHIKETAPLPQQRQEDLLYKSEIEYEDYIENKNKQYLTDSLKHITYAIELYKIPNENLTKCYTLRSKIYLSLGEISKYKSDLRTVKTLSEQNPLNAWQIRLDQESKEEPSIINIRIKFMHKTLIIHR